MLKLILLMASITQIVHFKCGRGCLGCNEEDECYICDVTNFYTLESGLCLKKVLPNCSLMDAGGDCYFCLKGFYLDSSTKKCIAVNSNNLIINCSSYTSNTSCGECENGYYLSSNQCLQITNSIDFCEKYQTAQKCKICQNQYLLNLEQTRCLPNSGITYCGFYSRLTCRKCQEDYIIDRNNILRTKSKFGNFSQLQDLSLFINGLIKGDSGSDFSKICIKKQVENCKVFQDSEKCSECQRGYLLDKDSQCIVQPRGGVKNCLKYSTAQECKECRNGYYLQDVRTCTIVNNIDNCVVYDGTVSSSECKECRSGYYSTRSSCLERQNSDNIKDCKELSKEKDQCEICREEKLLSTDGLKCFNQITNCLDHQILSSSSEELQCKKCNEGFYLRDNRCERGNVDNCSEYSNSLENCQKCLNEYFLVDNQCQRRTTLTNCETYSEREKDYCKQCEGGFFNFKIQSVCVEAVPINNCKEYSSLNPPSCDTCDLGFYLQNNSCVTIPEQNCSIYQDGVCEACFEGFSLQETDTNTECVSAFSFHNFNCNTLNNAGSNEIKVNRLQTVCLNCISQNYPLNYANHFLCVEERNLEFMGVSENILRCLKYDKLGGCVQCESLYYLEDGKCVNECAKEAYHLLNYSTKIENTKVMVLFEGYNNCEPEPATGALIYGIDYSQESASFKDIILQCKENYLPVVDWDSMKYSGLDPSLGVGEWSKNIVKKFPEINQCVAVTNDDPLISNCQYYQEQRISNKDVYRCLKCQHGYSSVIEKISNVQVIKSCKKNNSCSSTQYSGSDLMWSKLFSCHKCISSSKIPFLAVKTISISNPLPKNFAQYSLSQLNRSTNLDTTLNNVECLEDSPIALGYDTQNTTQLNKYNSLPSNCALAVLNLSVTDGDSLNNQTSQSSNSNSVKLAHYCAACKPGYQAVPMSDNFKYIKIQCQEINNCKRSVWFNSCSSCSDNHVYQVLNDQLNYHKCISNTDRNCFAGDDNGVCVMCLKGYNLNLDGICEEIRPPNCSSAENFTFKREYPVPLISYASYRESGGVGCNECRSGFKAVEANQDFVLPIQCTQSFYLQTLNKEETNYILNCQNYGYSEGVLCSQCLGGFSVNEEKNRCFRASQYCLVAESENQCSKCEEDKYLVQGNCLIDQVSFCEIPESENNSSQERCKTCIRGYYLTNDFQCSRGEVQNCARHQDFQSTKCLECDEGYGLFRSTTDFCFKIDQSLNCKNAILRSDSFYGATLNCQQCQKLTDYVSELQENITNPTQCFEIPLISNCEIYDQQDTLVKSTFKCLKCKPNFYLSSSFSCISRNYQSSSCEEYELQFDKCKECQDGFYIDEEGQCQFNPKGIPNCLEYQTKDICETCQKNYYLSSNECQEILEENLVSNCRKYSSSTLCEICDSDYYLSDNECLPSQADNCLINRDQNNCESCPKGFKLSNVQNAQICLSLSQSNCLIVNTNNQCQTCEKNYYPDSDGNCVRVSEIIPNCEFYETENTCQSCDQGYVLDSSAEFCSQVTKLSTQYDPNCSDYQDRISCSLCDPGYIFNNFECIICEQTGCLSCLEERCKVCLPNHFMTREGNCILQQLDQTPTDESSVNLIFLVSIFLII